MTRILFLILLVAVTFGCSRKEVVEATYENGNPKVVKYYHKKGGNLLLDREVLYYKNKQKKVEGEYKDELRTGQWKAWFENGTLWSEGTYKDGKRNGNGIFYHENGRKYIEGMYRDDIRVGAWRFYDTTGVLTREVDFDQVPGIPKQDSVQ
jgi:antitoxin component YwqK of YwqJK toxin-antitoxin module